MNTFWFDLQRKSRPRTNRDQVNLVYLLVLVCSILLPLQAKTVRSSSAIAEFKRSNPCPVNEARRGPCPGHQVDHIEPLCAGGADTPANMQWQTVADGKAKDRLERRQCAKK